VQHAAHSADPRQVGTDPAGGTPPEELAHTVAIGTTANQDLHRPDHHGHVGDRPVVEQSTMQALRGGSRAVNARIPAASGEDGDVA
jgi:hypothetical protein